MSLSLFKKHSLDNHALSIAAYLPGGKVFAAARDNFTNLFAFLRGLASEMARVEDFLIDLYSELDPRTTIVFIEEWESNLGIPDDCIFIADTIEERRKNILIKLTSLGAQTEEDFVSLALLLGFAIQITRPPSGPDRRFIWIISGVDILVNVPEYDVPFIPNATGGQTVMQCLFQKLRPANTELQFENL